MATEGIIQSLWIGGRLSTMGRLAVQSFLTHGHDFHLYCYEPVADVPTGATLKDAAEILPREQVFAYRNGFGAGSYSGGSNFFRYKLLLDRGGWWVDTDVVCLRPFVFPAAHAIATEDDPNWGIIAATCVIKQPAQSPLMQWVWRVCRQKDPSRLTWGEVGPRLMVEAVRALGMEEDLCPPFVFNPVAHRDWGALVDPARFPTLGPDVYGVHLWHQMWREHGADPDGSFPADCLYEVLRRRYLLG